MQVEKLRNGKSRSNKPNPEQPEIVKGIEFKIEKPKLAVCVLDIRIGGESLLTDKMNPDALRKYGETAAEKGEIQAPPLSPAQVAERGTYKTRDGKYGFPASGIRASIRDAAVTIPELSKAATNRAMIVMGDIIPLSYAETRVKEDVGRNSGPGRTPRLVYRMQFLDWELPFRVRLLVNEINPSQLYSLLTMAGLSIGIGNWRPGSGRGGEHGTFDVRQFELVEAPEEKANK